MNDLYSVVENFGIIKIKQFKFFQISTFFLWCYGHSVYYVDADTGHFGINAIRTSGWCITVSIRLSIFRAHPDCPESKRLGKNLVSLKENFLTLLNNTRKIVCLQNKLLLVLLIFFFSVTEKPQKSD